MPTLGVFGLALSLLAGVHAAFESTAQYAERRLGAYLWKEQDYLRLFTPAYHQDRGNNRLLIYGPSEARDGVLPEEFSTILGGLDIYQNAQSLGTLEDGLLVIDYLEAAYGRSAVPDAMIVGLSTRFVANIRRTPSPLVTGMRKYSPHFNVEGEQYPRTLVPKTAWEAARARWALLALQPDRYRRGMAAVAASVLGPRLPNLAPPKRLFRASKYPVGPRWSDEDLRQWFDTPGRDAVHRWDPVQNRSRTLEQFRALFDRAARLGIDLYFVNLPERSAYRERYPAGRYETHLEIVREAIGAAPFLDLRTFLRDDEFLDEGHPLWIGGIRVSREVARFIGAVRERRAAQGGHLP